VLDMRFVILYAYRT